MRLKDVAAELNTYEQNISRVLRGEAGVKTRAIWIPQIAKTLEINYVDYPDDVKEFLEKQKHYNTA